MDTGNVNSEFSLYYILPITAKKLSTCAEKNNKL